MRLLNKEIYDIWTLEAGLKYTIKEINNICLADLMKLAKLQNLSFLKLVKMHLQQLNHKTKDLAKEKNHIRNYQERIS